MGHYTDTVAATGKNRREAEATACDEYLYEHGHRCNIRGVERAELIEKVPPTKRVETPRRVNEWVYGRLVRREMIYVTYEPDPDAPPSEWLERWEFDLHIHA
jgi:hypothetical protein